MSNINEFEREFLFDECFPPKDAQVISGNTIDKRNVNTVNIRPYTSIPSKPLTQLKERLGPPTPYMLTLFGYLPRYLNILTSFFNNLNIGFEFYNYTKIDGNIPHDTLFSANFAVLRLSKDVEQIPEITTYTQFAPDVIFACYIGIYGIESIRRVPTDVHMYEKPKVVDITENNGLRYLLGIDQITSRKRFI